MSYAAFTALAKRLLTKRGITVTLTRVGTGTFDEDAGSFTGSGSSSATFKAVGLPPGPSATKELGTLVNRNVLEFYLSRLTGTLEPTPGDRIPFKGKTYTVIWAANYDPDASGLIFSKCYAEAGG